MFWEEPMAEEQGSYEREREVLIRSVEEAYEALRVIPGIDENGPLLVWLTDHLYQAHNRVEQPA
jgi:hypothetical protein